MSIFSQTIHLVRREIMLEQRQKYALYGVLLYLVSTVFVSKFSFLGMLDFHASDVKTGGPPMLMALSSLKVTSWNSLFWIILLFAAVTAVARTFTQETRGRLLYLYTIADPHAIFLAKLIYNILMMVGLGFAGLLMYSFLIGYPVQNTPLFLLSVFLGCTGLASAFTMISAIASRAGNNFTLTAILGFPAVLPMLLSAIRLSHYAVDQQGSDVSLTYLGVLVTLNFVIIALSWLLFPYLWRD